MSSECLLTEATLVTLAHSTTTAVATLRIVEYWRRQVVVDHRHLEPNAVCDHPNDAASHRVQQIEAVEPSASLISYTGAGAVAIVKASAIEPCQDAPV